MPFRFALLLLTPVNFVSHLTAVLRSTRMRLQSTRTMAVLSSKVASTMTVGLWRTMSWWMA